MLVIAAMRPGADVARVSQTLRDAGHELRLVWSYDELASALDAVAADAIIVDSGFDVAVTDTRLVERLRANGATSTSIVVLLPDTWPGDVAALFDAGADDVVRRPLMAAEVAVRVGRRYDARRGGAVAAACRWERFEFWRDRQRLVYETMLDMIGVQLEPEPAAPGRQLDVGGLVAMALPADRAECLVGIGVDARGATALANAMFGGATSAEMIADAVGELANAAAGAIKRAALPAGKSFSMGLPRVVAPPPRRHYRAELEALLPLRRRAHVYRGDEVRTAVARALRGPP